MNPKLDTYLQCNRRLMKTCIEIRNMMLTQYLNEQIVMNKQNLNHHVLCTYITSRTLTMTIIRHNHQSPNIPQAQQLHHSRNPQPKGKGPEETANENPLGQGPHHNIPVQ